MKNRRSFRFRLALISMGLSGLVLLVFGMVAWWHLSRAQLRSLDEELTAFGQRVASRSGPNVSGERQQDVLVETLGAEAAQHRFFAILNRNRKLLFESVGWPRGLDARQYPAGSDLLDPQPDLNLPEARPGDERPGRELRPVYRPQFYTATVAGRRFRLGVFRNADVIFISGADIDQISRDVTRLRNAFLVALPGALAVIALGAWWLGRKALRPIRVLESDMAQVSARALDQRLDAGRADVEFARIIETYNRMLERLERSFHQATRFSADASHELKTPLAIMRATLERGVAECRSSPQSQHVFSELLEQTGRQGAIIESLLLLSRADAGKLEISAEPVDLSVLVETWVEDAGLLAEGRNITVRSEIEKGLVINADPILLQRVAHNLFANAVRYNRDDGIIESCLSRTPAGIEWTIANTGDPIAAGDCERIFDRFERAQPAVDARPQGAGLGLSLVKEIIVAHGATVTAGTNEKGMVEMRLRFPQ